ncbi:phosphorylase b kinase gamma catalytic chain, skeletal muscle/heart isoform isoform X1 [Daphnia magna]|uniref:phosphorylase b kinase gamma catalytic chain, skeletal muscle/heart isoform isoform X1 n=1 Tax=Daphnia magna TaxID=35525 RepID=UPI001401F18D|nr:phosphorylase b kinase gamma catalytic chain, skeletal muscle/heart isoform isoform X1 [Daphnia magna]XP_032794464.1 phosphorylase b kinase gamma catalytic chain, skeletal muscle/heart isoform isoform X1 [Daphnia magna]
MARDETDDVLPDKDVAKEFYAKYEPKEILGRGVSSTVRRCVEKETGREYACKIMDINGDPSETEGPAMRESTLREIAILRRVAGHPYIIELHDVFESETFIFLVFELCRNGELFDYLTSVVTLSEKKTKYIMKQLFEALQHVHRMNIVHRDLKPENILLDDNLNVKLTDFGFARILQPGEKLFELVGTPGYLAPELLKSNMFEGYDGYNKEVDMWACGVIMFTLLIGCPPFWHRKQMVMLRNIMEGRYSFTSPEWDDITDAPKDLISKLLILDPKRRLTVDEALKHEFFQVLRPDDFSIISSSTGLGAPGTTHYHGRVFNARRMFRFGILCVQSMVRIRRLKLTPEPLSIMVARRDPYRMKAVRKVIDACAFRVYAHWVKKGEGQNRAALFEHHPKIELKHLYLSNLNQNRS